MSMVKLPKKKIPVISQTNFQKFYLDKISTAQAYNILKIKAKKRMCWYIEIYKNEFLDKV